MSKELFLQIGEGFTVKGAELYLGVNGKYPLTPKGRNLLADAVRKISKGEKINPSEHTGVLDGYQINLSGMALLEGLRGKAFLLAGNHTDLGPLSGFWQIFAVNRVVKTATGQEPHWVQAAPRMSVFNNIELPLVKQFIKKISEATHTILVGNSDYGNGPTKMFNTLKRGGIVAFYPEGETNKSLVRADPNAGRVILHAARRFPIVCFSGYPSGSRSLELIFSEGPDCETIGELIEEGLEKTKAGQVLADYTMRLIARFLPEELHGAYAQKSYAA